MQRNLQKQQQYSRPNLDQSKVIDSQTIEYQFICEKLREILQALTIEKQMWKNKMEKESQSYQQQLIIKQQQISQLLQQNEALRRQLANEKNENKSQLAYLKEKNIKIQLQRDSLANIIRYLQLKSKQLNYQMYQLKKHKNRRITQSSTKLSNILPTQYDPHKLFSPKDKYKGQSSQVSLTAIKNKDDDDQRSTKKAMEKMGQFPLLRIRSIGQIDETTRDNICRTDKKLSKECNRKELSSMKGKTKGVKLYGEKIKATKVKRLTS